MTAEEAVDVFWRAVEAGHFADLEDLLRASHRFRNAAARGEAHAAVVAKLRERIRALLPDGSPESWVDGLLAQGWAL